MNLAHGRSRNGLRAFLTEHAATAVGNDRAWILRAVFWNELFIFVSLKIVLEELATSGTYSAYGRFRPDQRGIQIDLEETG